VSHHVCPVGDLVDHEMTDDCVCGPRSEQVPREDGSFGWLVVHHSLDGREREEAQNAPSTE
jgi:hypothetical protein